MSHLHVVSERPFGFGSVRPGVAFGDLVALDEFFLPVPDVMTTAWSLHAFMYGVRWTDQSWTPEPIR